MNKVAMVALPFCLAACEGQAVSGPEATPAIPSTNDAELAMAADGKPPPGMYRAVGEDGSILIEQLRQDGSYVFSDDTGAVLEEGTYVQKSQAEICFTANAQNAPEVCFAEEIGADGVWRTTDPTTGDVSVIERIETD